jgi:hypothetical protein
MHFFSSEGKWFVEHDTQIQLCRKGGKESKEHIDRKFSEKFVF